MLIPFLNGTPQTEKWTLEAHKFFFDNYLIFSTGLGIFTYKNLEDILCIRLSTVFLFLFYIHGYIIFISLILQVLILDIRGT